MSPEALTAVAALVAATLEAGTTLLLAGIVFIVNERAGVLLPFIHICSCRRVVS